VSSNHRVVGDAKWLKSIAVPAAKWQAIAECIDFFTSIFI